MRGGTAAAVLPASMPTADDHAGRNAILSSRSRFAKPIVTRNTSSERGHTPIGVELAVSVAPPERGAIGWHTDPVAWKYADAACALRVGRGLLRSCRP